MSDHLGIEGAGRPAPAIRATAPGWRDPRLWVGVAIVAVCVVAGARLLAGADETVPVWSVSTDLAPGDPVTAEDLSARQVRFGDDRDLGRYFPADESLPGDLALTRPVGEGELLPRTAVGTAGDDARLQISIEVEPGRVPGTVGSGSLVDVYLLGGVGDDRRDGTPQEPALGSVTVVAAPAGSESFGTSGLRQLVLAVPEPEVAPFYELVDQLDDPAISIVARSE